MNHMSGLHAKVSLSKHRGVLRVKTERVERYLDSAKQCVLMAEQARDPDAKEMFLHCADEWWRLARQVES
jgi:hypothetical protein